MSINVGDKVVVVPDGKGGYIVSEGYVPKVGDSVIAHPLPSGGYVAVPITSPKVGDKVSAMVAPYSYVPFGSGCVISYNGFTDHDVGMWCLVLTDDYLYIYGDSEPHVDGSKVEKITDSPLYGAIEYKFTDSVYSEFNADLDVSVCLQDLADGTGIEVWIYFHSTGGEAPSPDWVMVTLFGDQVNAARISDYDFYDSGALVYHGTYTG